MRDLTVFNGIPVRDLAVFLWEIWRLICKKFGQYGLPVGDVGPQGQQSLHGAVGPRADRQGERRLPVTVSVIQL